jgi:hypothetical protein
MAGFFDGEGCISITKNGSVDIRITNTAKNVLMYLQSKFGGSIGSRAQKVNKAQYTYSMYGDEAVAFLTLMLPYLIEKKPQAETAVEYFELRQGLKPIRKPGQRGAFANPERDLLVEVFRDILSEQKKDEH